MTRGRKKNSTSKNEVIHIRIDDELSKTLESFCKASNLTKSEAIRNILENFLR